MNPGNLALDTNAYTALAKGDLNVLTAVRKAHKIILTYITLVELRAGFKSGKRNAVNEKNLQQFLNETRINIIYPDDQTTHHYASLFSQLRKQGTPIPANDLWIASLVIQHDLILYTFDSHFKKIPQIPLFAE